jgi:hypothetical protein
LRSNPRYGPSSTSKKNITYTPIFSGPVNEMPSSTISKTVLTLRESRRSEIQTEIREGKALRSNRKQDPNSNQQEKKIQGHSHAPGCLKERLSRLGRWKRNMPGRTHSTELTPHTHLIPFPYSSCSCLSRSCLRLASSLLNFLSQPSTRQWNHFRTSEWYCLWCRPRLPIAHLPVKVDLQWT